jgi:hypothetical protein
MKKYKSKKTMRYIMMAEHFEKCNAQTCANLFRKYFLHSYRLF